MSIPVPCAWIDHIIYIAVKTEVKEEDFEFLERYVKNIHYRVLGGKEIVFIKGSDSIVDACIQEETRGIIFRNFQTWML